MWTCSWVSPHTRSTHQAYGSKDRKGNLEEKYAAEPHRNNTMCWEDVTQEMKNIFLMEHWPWCGPKLLWQRWCGGQSVSSFPGAQEENCLERGAGCYPTQYV